MKKRKKTPAGRKPRKPRKSKTRKPRPAAGASFFVADALGGVAVMRRQAGGRQPVIIQVYRGRTAASRKAAQTLVKYFRQNPDAAKF